MAKKVSSGTIFFKPSESSAAQQAASKNVGAYIPETGTTILGGGYARAGPPGYSEPPAPKFLGGGGGSSYSESAPELAPEPVKPISQQYVEGFKDIVESTKVMTPAEATSAYSRWVRSLGKDVGQTEGLKQGASNIFLGYTPVTTPLPYETRGTKVDEGMKTTKFIKEPPKFSLLGFASDIVQAPASFISNLPQDVDKFSTGHLFGVQPAPTKYGLRETMQTQPKVLTPYEQLEKERILVENIETIGLSYKAETFVNSLYNKYEKQLQEDAKNVRSQKELDTLISKANESAKKEADNYVNKLNEEYQTKAEQRDVKRVEKYFNQATSQNFWRNRFGNLIRLPLYSIPVYGGALVATDIAGIPKTVKESIEFGKRYPGTKKAMALETVASIATFAIGGKVLSSFKGKIKAAKIKEALNNATIEIKSSGKVVESTLKVIDLASDEKAAVRNLLNAGGSAKLYKTKIIPGKGFEKSTPKILGRFLELSDSNGNFISNIGIGKIKATLDGKIIESMSFNRVLSKATAETTSGLGEFVVKTTTPKFFGIGKKIKAKKYSIFEETKLVSSIKKGGKRLTISESINEILGGRKGVKYKGEELLPKYGKTPEGFLVYPDFPAIKGTGTPYLKGKSVDIYRGKAATISKFKAGEKVSLMNVQKFYDAMGFGKAEKIKAEVKSTKVKTPLSKTFAPVKLKESIQVKNIIPNLISVKKTAAKKSLVETSYPTYVGGTSIREGQKTINMQNLNRVLGGGVTTTALFAEETPGAFSKSFNRVIGTELKAPSIQEVKAQERAGLDYRQILGYGLKYKEETKVKPTTITVQKPKEESKITQRISQILGGVQVQVPKQTARQKKLLVEKQFQPTPKLSFFGFKFKPVITPRIKFPKAYGEYYVKPKPKKAKAVRKAYAPSLAAYQLGITAPKGYKTKQKFTGLEIRPLQYKKKQGFTKKYFKKINNFLLGSAGTKKKSKKGGKK